MKTAVVPILLPAAIGCGTPSATQEAQRDATSLHTRILRDQSDILALMNAAWDASRSAQGKRRQDIIVQREVLSLYNEKLEALGAQVESLEKYLNHRSVNAEWRAQLADRSDDLMELEKRVLYAEQEARKVIESRATK
jgi:hypothetical protein